MASQCAALGLDNQFIDAVVGNSLSDEDLAHHVERFAESGLTKGEVGCALSHQHIYQTMVEHGLPLALILEDDALCLPTLPALLDDIAQIDQPHKPRVYLLTAPEQYIENNALSVNGVKRFFKAAQNNAAVGYVINQAGAQTLLKLNRPILFEADRWDFFCQQSRLTVYCAVPHVVDCADNDKQTSSLETERQPLREKRWRFLKKIRKSQPGYHLKRLFRILIIRRFERLKNYP